jgi:hypothetical protein
MAEERLAEVRSQLADLKDEESILVAMVDG